MTILNEEQLPTQFEGFIDLRLPLALNHANVLNVSKLRDIFIHGAQISNFGALVGNEMLLKNVHKLYPICEQGQKLHSYMGFSQEIIFSVWKLGPGTRKLGLETGGRSI